MKREREGEGERGRERDGQLERIAQKNRPITDSTNSETDRYIDRQETDRQLE